MRQRTDLWPDGGHHGLHCAHRTAPQVKETGMSKRPHGNKEAKKPKRAAPPAALHPITGATGPVAVPSGPQKLQQGKK